MYKKQVLLIMLLHSLLAQAAPGGEAPLGPDKQTASAVSRHPSSPRLRSSIALVYDAQGKRTLYTKRADAVVPIASISKLMTAMVVLDARLPMDEKIRITMQDVDMLKMSSSRMRPGTTLTRGDLLKLALMSSENRAAAALARTYPGGTEAAVAVMNAKARQLGMRDTHFLDPTGLNSGNVSTAQDLVKMVLAAQAYEPIHRATTSTMHIVKGPGSRPQLYVNTNPLVRSASWDIGVSKTGYISEAGQCLVMQAKIRNQPVVFVLLDSQNKNARIADAIRIRKWMETASRQGDIQLASEDQMNI